MSFSSYILKMNKNTLNVLNDCTCISKMNEEPNF